MPEFVPNIAKQVAQTRRDVAKLKSRLITSADWVSLLPIGNLIAQGAPYGELSYYLTLDGWAVFEGMAKTTAAITAGGTLCTLPADVPYPSFRKPFNVQTTAGAMRLDIDSAGVVYAMSALPTIGSYISFEGVRYRW